MIGLKRILVPIDFSEPSEAALRYGIELARAFGGRLHIIHMPEHPGEGAETEFPIGLFENMHNIAIDRLGELMTEAEKNELKPEYSMRLGKPGTEITKYAEQHEIDLIVMGTHGRTGVAHVLMGSVAERVVRTAPCPVLTVRHPEHEFIRPDATVDRSAHLDA